MVVWEETKGESFPPDILHIYLDPLTFAFRSTFLPTSDYLNPIHPGILVALKTRGVAKLATAMKDSQKLTVDKIFKRMMII